jgi:hypothetical protein
VCIAGHIFAFFFYPAAFPFYFAAVVALELGSCASCYYALRADNFRYWLYAACMTTSNAAAFYNIYQWVVVSNKESVPAAGVWVTILVCAVLLLLRQKDCFDGLPPFEQGNGLGFFEPGKDTEASTGKAGSSSKADEEASDTAGTADGEESPPVKRRSRRLQDKTKTRRGGGD